MDIPRRISSKAMRSRWGASDAATEEVVTVVTVILTYGKRKEYVSGDPAGKNPISFERYCQAKTFGVPGSRLDVLRKNRLNNFFMMTDIYLLSVMF